MTKEEGFAFLWKDSANMDLLACNNNMIDVKVRMEDEGRIFRFTGFYVYPIALERSRSWQLLRSLHYDEDLCWIVDGDFNEILHGEGKKGNISRGQRQNNSFREAVSLCGLHDLQYISHPFIWSNGKTGDSNIQCRLDRFFWQY